MVLGYIKIYVPETVNMLYLLSDWCPGQSRNHTFIRCLLSLTDRFDEVTHYFPRRGHSFLNNNWSFADINRYLRKQKRVYIPDEYEATISKSIKNFTVHKMKLEDVLQFKEWWPAHFPNNHIGKKFRGSQRFHSNHQ